MSILYKWEALQRLRFIEAMIYTKSEVCTGDLISTFGIGRAQATKDFTEYMQSLRGKIFYDATKKRYVAEKDFKIRLFENEKDINLFMKFIEKFS